MAGHSKWANIKRRKAVVDAAKSRVWTKIIREITISTRDGGPDPTGNPRLSLAIDAAKAANMPKDNIERAIKKGVGDKDSAAILEIVYEGYGPGGIAYVVETTTDNATRTVGEVRHAFSKYGGNLGTNGSVGYLFDRKGVIQVLADGVDEDALTLAAIEAGAEDIRTEDGLFEIITAFADFHPVRSALVAAGVPLSSAELHYVPATSVSVSDEELLLQNFKLMEKLEECDDVANVFNNLEMDDRAIRVAESL